MLNIPALVEHWGYLAIVVVVLLGNVGLPVPEETILLLAGYLVWDGQLDLGLVVLISIVSAVGGDSLGYWMGRRYGPGVVERYAERLLITPDRFRRMCAFVVTHGAVGIIVARFLPGIRFMAGPIAGTAGVTFPAFLVPNIVGAMIFVPATVGLGYAAGLGLADRLDRIERMFGQVEYLVLALAGGAAAITWAWRALRRRALRHESRTQQQG
jgi:membrane protein DedA with SNARE-associated domain